MASSKEEYFPKEEGDGDHAAFLSKKISEGKMLPYWAIITPEVIELHLVKAQLAIFVYIVSVAGWNKEHKCAGVCYRGTNRIADETHTHPDYVRFVVRLLEWEGLITRVKRPGHSTELRPVDKLAWLAAHPHGNARQAAEKWEETKDEAQIAIAWRRLFILIPTAKRLRYEKRMKMNFTLFRSALDELQDSVDREHNSARLSTQQIKDRVGLLEFFFKRKMEANGKK